MQEVRKVILTSDPMNLYRVEEFVNDIHQHHHICPKIYPNILITLTEAVSNAIHHGNNADINKKIAICCRIKSSKITFIISDEGKGFNHKELPDPTAPERIEQENGRGVFIMKQLSDKLRFTDNGRTVEIQFSI
jgi:serine/threonine-protein kinase RsbW